MTEITCFYVEFEHGSPINMTFIKYKNFMKILLDKRKIVIAIENLKNYQKLFEFYILSLLLTKNSNKISTYDDRYKVYGVFCEKIGSHLLFNGRYEFIMLDNYHKNPLISQEPKRETSIKKLKKFFKMMDNYFEPNINSLKLTELYLRKTILDTDIYKIIQYEKEIEILTCIRSVNRDVYSIIKNFM